jgi:hypothetical protein
MCFEKLFKEAGPKLIIGIFTLMGSQDVFTPQDRAPKGDSR